MIAVQPEDRKLAAVVAASARQFGMLFAKMQMRQPAIQLDALPTGVVAQEELIAHGIAFARLHGWLPQLLVQCYVDGFAEPGLIKEAEEQKLIDVGSELESIQNHARGFGQAAIVAEEMSRIVRQVCRIDIDGEPHGTGFLIRPDMVMTAYHVVSKLLDSGTASEGSSKRIRVVFDDYAVLNDGHTQRQGGRVLLVAENWLAHWSACHDDEIAGRLPEDLELLVDRLDFALIRLAGIARVGLSPIRLAATGRLRIRDQIHIFQHPSGRALAIDQDEVSEVVGADVRFLHSVNTEAGSSGSPCFNREYHVVGMHQAGPKNGPSLNRDTKSRNRGVQTFHVVDILKTLGPVSPSLSSLAELTETRPGHPVLGRSETQAWVWNELATPSKPILVLDGMPGVGKSFTFDLLRSLLPPAAHDVVRIDAAEIASREPESFASFLLDQLRYAFEPLPGDPGDTTPVRWQRDRLLDELIERLDAGRTHGAGKQPSGIWIVIDDIHKASIGSETPISAFLYALYAASLIRPWLRFVLLGFRGDIPSELQDATQSFEIARPTDEELRNYLYGKVAPSRQAGLPQWIDILVGLARQKAGAPTASSHLAQLQAQMRTTGAAISQVGLAAHGH